MERKRRRIEVYTYPVDGSIYAQPLYVPDVKMADGTHNVLYVVTMNDKVYAFDAEKPGSPLWTRNLADAAAGATPVAVADITGDNDLNIHGGDERIQGIVRLTTSESFSGLLVRRLAELRVPPPAHGRSACGQPLA